MEPTVNVLAAVLALTFAWAALAKVARARRWLEALERYGFRGMPRAALAVAVPAAEFAVPILFALGGTRSAAALTLALVAAFSLVVLNAHRIQGDRLPCGCFGGARDRDYRLMLARNAFVAALAASVLLAPPSGLPSGAEGVDVVVPIALSVAGLAVIAWMIWQVSTSLKQKQQR